MVEWPDYRFPPVNLYIMHLTKARLSMLLGAQQYLDEVKKGHNPFQKSLEAKTDKCTVCQIVLQEALTGYLRFNGNPYCSDHYFDELGAMVEKRPLGLPRSHTGRHALG